MPKLASPNSQGGDAPDDGAVTLTPALWELLSACLELGDYDGKKLANHLCISVRTVYSRTYRINQELGTHSLAGVVARLVREGILRPPHVNAARDDRENK